MKLHRLALIGLVSLLVVLPALVGFRSSTSASGTITRVAGENRFSTSAAVSMAAFPTAGSAKAVVLASGRNFPDALSGVPLATTTQGPLLLTEKDAIPSEIVAEIQRVLPSGATIYILGGLSVITQGVQDQLGSLGYLVTRLSGNTRYETSRAISEKLTELRGGPSQAAYVVSGTSFADALSVSALAAFRNAPVVLTQPTSLSQAASDVLSNPGVVVATIVGGTSAVSSGVEQAISALGISTDRISGSSRYDTSRKIADAFRGLSASETVGVASGQNYPDALSAGAHLATMSAPLLLVTKDNVECLPSSLYLFDNNSQLSSGFLYGGGAAISTTSEAKLNSLLGGTNACSGSGTTNPPPSTELPSYSYSGNGDQVVGPFALEKGVTISTSSYSGESNFIVTLLDSQGGWEDLIANVIGSYNGSTLTSVSAKGNYSLEIKSDGAWSISLQQPRPSSAPSTASFSGTGPTAPSAFYMSNGLKTFNLSHTGSSNFIVTLYDKNGNWIELLANEIGNYSGSSAASISSSGVYYLDIEADGEWGVSIS
jgi:putative cell wall-binding protein